MRRHYFGPGFRWGPDSPIRPHHVHIIAQAASAAPSDTWLNIALGVGSLATLLAVVVGGLVGLRYSRKANVSITATAHKVGDVVVVAARPSVTAIGPFKLRFSDEDRPRIHIFDMLVTDESEGSKIWRNE